MTEQDKDGNASDKRGPFVQRTLTAIGLARKPGQCWWYRPDFLPCDGRRKRESRLPFCPMHRRRYWVPRLAALPLALLGVYQFVASKEEVILKLGEDNLRLGEDNKKLGEETKKLSEEGRALGEQNAAKNEQIVALQEKHSSLLEYIKCRAEAAAAVDTLDGKVFEVYKEIEHLRSAWGSAVGFIADVDNDVATENGKRQSIEVSVSKFGNRVLDNKAYWLDRLGTNYKDPHWQNFEEHVLSALDAMRIEEGLPILEYKRQITLAQGRMDGALMEAYYAIRGTFDFLRGQIYAGCGPAPQEDTGHK